MDSIENFANEDPRWAYILNAILEFAGGNFAISNYPKGEGDQLDALAEGIIMLGEELKRRTISDEYLSNIYKGITDILLILNDELEIQEINQSALELLEFTKKDFNKINLTHLCPEIMYRDDIRDKLKKQGNFNDFKNLELKLFTKSSQVLTVSASFSKIQGNWRDGHRILFIAKDVSKLVRVQRDLKERNDELSTLIYRIAHDLRAPLSNVMGLVNMTKDVVEAGTTEKGEILEMLNMMTVSATRLDQILRYFNEILYIREHDVSSANININSCVNEAIQIVNTQFPNIKYTITTKIAKDIEFAGPYDLIKTMFLNLLQNAITHNISIGASLLIGIDVFVKAKYLHIRIRDNGVGIANDLQDFVFNMFVKGHSETQGAGLGLYFVKNLVTQLNGDIELTSTPINGTEVHITLPVANTKNVIS